MYAAFLGGVNNEFSILSWKFDVPSVLEDYNAFYENRAKGCLKELNMFSDADILCLQGLALSIKDVQLFLSCYNLVSYANGCCIALKKYAKHFIPLYKTAFLHGTSVLFQAQDAIDLKLHICSINCHERKDHDDCVVLREEKPALYLGTGIYTDPAFAKMKLLGTINLKDDVQGIALDVDTSKESVIDSVVKIGLNKESKMPQKSLSSTDPVYITVGWKGFHRVAPENNAYTAFSKNQRIAVKSEAFYPQHKLHDWKNVERLPHGVAIEKLDVQISSMQKEHLMGKSIDLYTPSRLRRLYGYEFTVLYWNIGGPLATKDDRELAILELTHFGADIVALQGLQGLQIDILRPYYTIVQANQYGAVLIHKRSSLLYKDPVVIIPLQGLGCTVYDAENPNDEILVYCVDLQDATLYSHNFKMRPYNSILMGTNLHANKISLSESLLNHSLYHVEGDKNNQILITAFPHKVRLMSGKVFWNNKYTQVYSGVGILTKYGKKTQTKTLSNPLFATFEWDGFSCYKMDIPLQKISQHNSK